MKRIVYLTLGLCLALFFAGCVAMQPQSASQPDRRDILYTCDCGPQCTCKAMSTHPGDCACNKPMKWGHVLKIEGNEALLCQCKEGCQCKLDPNDPTKCGCGMPVKRVDLTGSDIYFCNCGGSCFCNTVSNHPGTCKCGMQLKKAE